MMLFFLTWLACCLLVGPVMGRVLRRARRTQTVRAPDAAPAICRCGFPREFCKAGDC